MCSARVIAYLHPTAALTAASFSSCSQFPPRPILPSVSVVTVRTAGGGAQTGQREALHAVPCSGLCGISLGFSLLPYFCRSFAAVRPSSYPSFFTPAAWRNAAGCSLRALVLGIHASRCRLHCRMRQQTADSSFVVHGKDICGHHRTPVLIQFDTGSC